VDILSAWLQHRCEGRVLVTSRARLGISGERVVHVEPLAPGHGVQLVKQRLAFLGASVKEEKKLFALHKAVDGMPLALDLAAARVARLGVERVVKRLTEAPASLKAFRRPGPERHRSVWSTVEWSWELLDEVEQRVLSQAAVFRGGVTLHALEVALDGQIPADREFDACVAFLVEHSLMKLQRPGRVVLYEAVREVAESHLVDREDALRRHTKGVLACCEVNWIEHHRVATLGMLGPMRADRQNLLAVLERVRGTDQVDAWCRVVLGLSLLWVRDMKPRIAEDEIGRLLEAPGIEAFKPRLLMAYGGPLASLGRHEESLKGLEWAVIQLRKQRDTHILVFCVLALVSAYRFFGDHDAMRRHLTEARELAAGDPALLSFVVLRQAHCEYYLRNHKEALALCRQVVQENLSPESRLATEGLEAMVLFAMGDDQATAARFHGVAKQWENVGNMHGMAYALVGAAKAEEREGHTRAAAESFARAAAIFRRGGANQYADKVQKYGSDVLAGIDDTGEP